MNLDKSRLEILETNLGHLQSTTITECPKCKHLVLALILLPEYVTWVTGTSPARGENTDTYLCLTCGSKFTRSMESKLLEEELRW